MKNMFCRALLVITSFAAMSATSYAHDDWGYRARASAAAHQVSFASQDFAQQVFAATGFSHLSGDAQQLAGEAEHFHVSIESGAPYDHLTYDYYALERSYNHMSQSFYYAYQLNQNWNVHEHWHQVEAAWQELSWTFRSGHGPLVRNSAN
jgi:hypothetical protein